MATYNLFLQGVVNRLLYLTYNPFPLDLAYFDRLTIIIVTQFTTKTFNPYVLSSNSML
jgi:hypothetical protein